MADLARNPAAAVANAHVFVAGAHYWEFRMRPRLAGAAIRTRVPR